MKRIKTILVTVLIILITVGYLPGRGAVWADELGTTPTETVIVEQIPEPSPTPVPDLLPTPDPCNSCSTADPAVVDQANDGIIDNQTIASSDTGNNTIDPSPPPEESSLSSTDSTVSTEAIGEASSSAQIDSQFQDAPQADSSTLTEPGSITTGMAQTEVNVQNTANTNQINSTITYTIENVYIDTKGNIVVVAGPTSNSATPVVATQTNSADITNTVDATSNSGINTINGVDGLITTGNAYTMVNIINLANSNLINSSLQFVIINIFGDVDGNIILPEFASNGAGLGQTTGGNISQTNSADVQNTIGASSNTGGNQAGGSIQTGNATTAVNLQNFINFNLLGGVYYHLFINTTGNWNGNFLGWGNIGSMTVFGGQSTFGSGLDSDPNGTGVFVDATQTNQATVNNLILASANTGQNTIGGRGNIQTGNAFTALNLINFINTNLINNVGYFGMINIMGNLNGDIGGQSKFSPSAEETSVTVDSNTAEIRASGGQLTTSMRTNVGTHVNGGDTVLFFITVQNTGTGPVYDGKVTFNLNDSNGVLGVLQNFDVGKLNPGQKSLISFSFVLAKKLPLGTYEALELANGKVGSDNGDVSAQANATFQVGASSFGSVLSSVGNGDVQAVSDVAGSDGAIEVVAGGSAASLLWQIYTALGTLGMLYIAQRLLVKPYRIAVYYFGKRRQWQQSRGLAIASKFLSRFASGAMALRHLIF